MRYRMNVQDSISAKSPAARPYYKGMKIEANRIIITGDDPDAAGTYDRKDVEQEMADVGVPNVPWIQWVLGHAFDEGVPAQIVAALESGVVTEIKFFTERGDLAKVRLA